jgi:DNA primase
MEVPYFTRRGKHYRTKLFRWSGEPRSVWLGPSKPQIPYGLWRFPTEGKFCFITEGESDLLALALAYPKLPVIGLPGAGSWKSEWAPLFAGFDRVYLSFDGDPAGDGRTLPDKKPLPPGRKSLVAKVTEDLPGARYVMLPDYADTRDVLQLLGKEAYKLLIAAADRMAALDQARVDCDAAFRERHRVEVAFKERRQ